MNGIYGRAAAGLEDTSWAVNESVAKFGAKGEQRSAAVLNKFGDRAAVLHDLRVPIPGFKANIDHVVVSGNRVLIIDSKMWKPGFYWTLAGVNRRGLTKVPHTAKGQDWVSRAMVGYLAGTGAKIQPVHLVIWPSKSGGKASTWLLRVSGAVVIGGAALESAVRRFIGRKPADGRIVDRLAELTTAPVRGVHSPGT
ncbi:nuclease-related domain-containing protein [Arthrobacter sp. IK3]|uniref:nuclease-related domain-containing protein n=1 Tax=Arthrobacter sp. IK3 TaxID=3448169 RepID=UPI003EE2200B